MEKVILEESSNTHIMEGKVKVVKKLAKMNTVVLDTEDAAVVLHGHHATVKTEGSTKRVIKITQQEFNPVTKAMMNSFD